MKTLFFDAGPIISLTMNNLLWLLKPLKNAFKGSFVVTPGVYYELVDKPLATKRFKFEALQVKHLIEEQTLSVLNDDEVVKKAQELLDLANSILNAHGNNIKIAQLGEMETIAAALLYQVDTIVVDERITRTLIENPQGLEHLMERRLHMNLQVNKEALRKFQEATRHLKIIRSIELVTIAFEQGLLDKFIVDLKQPRKELLDSVLWGLKLNGASITDNEIKKIIKMQKF